MRTASHGKFLIIKCTVTLSRREHIDIAGIRYPDISMSGTT